MGSETAPSIPPAPESPVEPKRSTSRKRKRLVIVLVIVVAALAIIFWGWSSTGVGYVDVGVLYDKAETAHAVPDEYLNGTIELRGVVEGWDGSVQDLEFRLVDDDNSFKSVEITLNGTYPAGFANSKSIAATGELQSTMPLRLVASELTIGCSSKY
ncbi:MAG TPA: cytochrome c maturation protein CcmE [Thermoplasmata archaeon]|jgi:cytochrome c-type biogenesis protein CcmE